jgi:hypothetical protein
MLDASDGWSKNLKSKLEIVHPGAAGHDVPTYCPNCQVQAYDKFCSACGESLVVHAPSAYEFIHEFVGHFVALEGKLWSTLRLLVLKPGALTLEFLRGRRVPFVNPLRMYLTMSLIVFALIKLFGIDLPQVYMEDKAYGVRYVHDLFNPENPKKPRTVTLDITVKEVAESDSSSLNDFKSLPDLIASLESVNATWANNIKTFMRKPPHEKNEILNHGFLANLPYMLIGALPLFALYLKLMYLGSGRRYGEHLVFALHFSTFVFLLASAMILLPGNFAWLVAMVYSGAFRLISAWDCLQLMFVLWGLVYLPVALRRVYGGTRWANGARALVLSTVHFAVIVMLVAAAELIPILKHAG